MKQHQTDGTASAPDSLYVNRGVSRSFLRAHHRRITRRESSTRMAKGKEKSRGGRWPCAVNTEVLNVLSMSKSNGGEVGVSCGNPMTPLPHSREQLLGSLLWG